MFSDLPNHPRKQYVRRKSAALPPSIRAYKSKLQANLDLLQTRKPDVVGADRFKYFHFIKSNVGENFIPELDLRHPALGQKSPKPEPKQKNKKNQTIFRESSVQTSPWEPSFVVTGDTEPELLKLDFLKWGKTYFNSIINHLLIIKLVGSGLPPGVHEVQLLERARMKRAWEERCEVRDAADLEKRRNIIAAMERDEWAFREQVMVKYVINFLLLN
jgi:hypothetical protein